MTRYMTRKQFRTAVERCGWHVTLMWVCGTGKDGNRTDIGFVMKRTARGWKNDYRATLAKAARELESAL